MHRSESNANKRWANAEAARLEKRMQQNASKRVIAPKPEVAEDVIQSKESDEGTVLKATDQSPNARQKHK
jgi:hypothetical protein